jgi:hypothetical protein
MANKQLKIKRARQNIKLLEEADHAAISKVDEPKYKKILTEQERQLHHYLAQYLDPNYLPAGIAKEYEFPKYFYYTVNSKQHGIVQRRTRTDSAMFKRFMKNKAKKAAAKEQGIFTITEQPIKINIDMPPTYPKKKASMGDEYKSLLGNVDLGDFEDKMPNKKYTAESIHESFLPKKKLPIKSIEQRLSFTGNKEYNPPKFNDYPSKEIIYEYSDSDDEGLLSEKELRAILAAQRRDPLDIYVGANWKKFRNLLESVGQMPPYYDKLSDFKKDEFCRLLARDFFKRFFNTRTGQLMITPSDYKQLKSFGTKNYLIYKPSNTTKQEKELKVKSEKKFIDTVLKINPSFDKIAFVGEDLEESMPSQMPTKKNISIKRKDTLIPRKPEERKLDMTNKFTILGLTPKATIDDVKRAYKKLALIYHPDKPTGDAKKFIIIDDAYKDLLKMIESRQIVNIDMDALINRPPVPISEEIANRKAEVQRLKKELTSQFTDARRKKIIISEIERLTQSIKMLSSMARDMRTEPTPKKERPAPKKAAPTPPPETKQNPSPSSAKKIEDIDKADIPKYWSRPNDAILLLKHFYPDSYKNLNNKANDLYNKRKSINIPQMYTFLPKELVGGIFQYLQETAWDDYIEILFEMTEDMENIITALVGTILYTRADPYEEKRTNPSYFIQITKYMPKKLLKKDKLYDLTHYKYKEEPEEELPPSPPKKAAPTPKKAAPTPKKAAPTPKKAAPELKAEKIPPYEYYSNLVYQDVPKGIKLTENVKDLIKRKQDINDKLQQLKTERADKKIQSLIFDLNHNIGVYNMLYDITRREWDKNAPKPEF